MQTKTILMLLLLACAVLTVGTLAQRTSTRIERSSSQSEWMMNTSENGRGLEVRIRGKAEFNDEYSDLKSLSPDGSVRVRDSRGTQVRRLEIEPDNNGNLKRTYWVNDKVQEFDASARQWMMAMMLDLVRQGGYDAERRVARLMAQGGANAVLSEIALINGSYGKSQYFKHLLRQQTLDSATVQRVVQQIAREVTSDYEKRQALGAV